MPSRPSTAKSSGARVLTSAECLTFLQEKKGREKEEKEQRKLTHELKRKKNRERKQTKELKKLHKGKQRRRRKKWKRLPSKRRR